MTDLFYPTEPNDPDVSTLPALLKVIQSEFVEYYHWEDDPNAVEGVNAAYWHMKGRIDDLRCFFDPVGHLPGNGEQLWNEIQTAVDTFRHDNQRLFFSALGKWLQWVVATSKASQSETKSNPTPDVKSPEQPVCGIGSEKKTNAISSMELGHFLRQVHQPSSGMWVGPPLSQKEIAIRMGTNQSSVQRAFVALYGEDGSKRYIVSFAVGKCPGYRKIGEDGTSDCDGIVYDNEK